MRAKASKERGLGSWLTSQPAQHLSFLHLLQHLLLHQFLLLVVFLPLLLHFRLAEAEVEAEQHGAEAEADEGLRGPIVSLNADGAALRSL